MKLLPEVVAQREEYRKSIRTLNARSVPYERKEAANDIS